MYLDVCQIIKKDVVQTKDTTYWTLDNSLLKKYDVVGSVFGFLTLTIYMYANNCVRLQYAHLDVPLIQLSCLA